MRAEPKIVTAGRSILSTASKPSRNSSAIEATCFSRSTAFSSAERIRLSSIKAALLEVAGHVRRVHAEHEEHCETEVEHSDDHALVWLDLVVLLHLGKAPSLPPAPELRGGEDQDDDQDRVRPVEDEAQQGKEAHQPENGMQRGADAAPVQRNDGEQVEEVDEEAEKGKRLQRPGVEGDSREVDRERSGRAQQRARDREPRLE